jgi:hypothetical protein
VRALLETWLLLLVALVGPAPDERLRDSARFVRAERHRKVSRQAAPG